LIPNALYEILTKLTMRGKSIEYIKNYFEHKQDNFIDEYFTFLESRELGFYSDKFWKLPQINLVNYSEPKSITNSIIDFDTNSKHKFNDIVVQLSDLNCEAVELRFYFSLSEKMLCEKLYCFDGTTIRDVEILFEYNDLYNTENILAIRRQFARLRKITLYNAHDNKIITHEELTIIYTKQNIDSEKHCGVINPWYFISKTETFGEFINFNSCLNRKISVDKQGNIKNCPSMSISYGNIQNTALKDVLNIPEFKKYWNIKKDDIKVCNVCEFRYLCQDCRAYLTNDCDSFSKPLKCNYNPYE
jgi:SPASM domain peptide maturase of grasp-with-spasm system